MNSKLLYSLFTLVLAALLGYYLGQNSGENYNVKNLLEFERAKTIGFSADWMMRFDSAFSNQPASVAIWEGSNLLIHLTGKSSSVPAFLENSAMLTHAKLSRLYEELGESNQAAFHIKAAAILMPEKSQKDPSKAIEGVTRFAQTNYFLRRKATVAE